jgi:hypothetical protein
MSDGNVAKSSPTREKAPLKSFTTQLPGLEEAPVMRGEVEGGSVPSWGAVRIRRKSSAVN